MLGRSKRILLPVAAVAIAAACAGGAAGPSGQAAERTSAPVVSAAPTATPAAPPTPSPSPRPTPTPASTPDVAAVGQAYLAIADIFATRGQPAVNAIAKGGSYTPEDWGRMHQAVVDVYDETIPMLDEIEFPDDIADEAAQLRAYWVDARALFAEVAADPSADIWNDFVATAEAYGKVGDAIRAYLGLPPRPTLPPD